MDLIPSLRLLFLTVPRFLDDLADVRGCNNRTIEVVWIMNNDGSKGSVSAEDGSSSNAVHVNRSSNNGLNALNKVIDILATGDINRRVDFRRFEGVVDDMIQGCELISHRLSTWRQLRRA